MSAAGVMAMPADFRYREVFLKGKPLHDRYDPFRIRHPSMDRRRRAKIFSPFDALKGFNEAVAAKDVLYEDRITLSREDADELNRRLGILHALTGSSRAARANRVQVTVTWYELCCDEDHEAYGLRGRYRTTTGICRKVDARVTNTILLDETACASRSHTVCTPRTETGMRIRLEDVLRIEGPEDLFCERCRFAPTARH